MNSIVVICISGYIHSIKAEKTINEKESESLISNQRPNVIDKKIRLPINIKQGEEKIESAKCLLKKPDWLPRCVNYEIRCNCINGLTFRLEYLSFSFMERRIVWIYS